MKILVFIFFITLNLYSSEIKYSFKNGANINTILNHEIWKKLLYDENGKTQINNKEYLLNKEGESYLMNELIKTVNSYEIVNIKDYNLSSRCTFPARYYWLSKYIDFPNYEIIDKRCINLNKFKPLNDTKSISLILVSGYLGNPASVFGHSFIKLNQNNDEDLFDTSINFGALVPENENVIRYIFKGIFGGYEAGFSDKYFYTQDLIYNHIEFRDMWDYKLNLKEEEKLFLLLHLWEIIGKKFDYYFLDKNCGYRVSELMELIINKNIIDTNKPWYLPVETFYKIEELNEENNIIDSIKYIPSYESLVHKKFNLLKNEEKNFIVDVVKSNFKSIDLIDNIKEEEKKINILNFLVDYLKYLEIKNKKDEEFEKNKNNILLKRLKLKASMSNEINFENKLSPAKSNYPILFSLGNSNYKNIRNYKTIEFSPFSIESLGKNSLDFSELTIFRTNIAFSSNKTYLNKFEIIDISKINKLDSDLEKKLDLSWKLNFGLTHIINENKDFENSLYVSADFGKSNFIKENFLLYYMINSTFYKKDYKLELKPYLGVKYKFNEELKSSFEVGKVFYKDTKFNYINSEVQYNFNQKYALNLKYNKEEYEHFIINLKWFFR